MASERRKPVALIVRTVDQAAEVMKEISEINRELGRIEAAVNERIDKVKAEVKPTVESFTDRKKYLEQALMSFAEHEKPVLFMAKRSVETLFGMFGYRRSSSIKAQPKHTLASALQALNTLIVDLIDQPAQEGQPCLEAGIRTKQELNKEALMGWAPEWLNRIGLKVEETDTFYYELKVEEVEGEA